MNRVGNTYKITMTLPKFRKYIGIQNRFRSFLGNSLRMAAWWEITGNNIVMTVTASFESKEHKIGTRVS